MPDDELHDRTDDQTADQTDEQDRVRRLLADLATTDATSPAPVPDDVVARLDAALADAARGATTTRDTTTRRPLAPVVPLRRRLGPALVAAAALVVVGGIGITAVTQSGSDSATSSADAAGGSAAESQSESPQSESQSDARADSDAAQDESLSALSDSAAPTDEAPGAAAGGDTGRMLPAPYLTLGGFADGVATLVSQGQVATGVDAAVDADERQRVRGSGCVQPDPADGYATLVSLEGDPAVLVVAPPADDRQQVEVRSCAAGETLAQTEVGAAG